MTPSERRFPKTINGSRKKRIAKPPEARCVSTQIRSHPSPEATMKTCHIREATMITNLLASRFKVSGSGRHLGARGMHPRHARKA